MIHTRESLGVPAWFFCDGCSKSPDLPWLSPCCDAHDWDYWRGGNGDKDRAAADRDFRARIKHNAKFWPGSWFDRLWRPPMGEIYYAAVTRFGGPSWRAKREGLVEPIDWEYLALQENKHSWHIG